MRGRCDPQLGMLAFVDLDARIPSDHPLRAVTWLADRALTELSPVFDRMDAVGGPRLVVAVDVLDHARLGY